MLKIFICTQKILLLSLLFLFSCIASTPNYKEIEKQKQQQEKIEAEKQKLKEDDDNDGVINAYDKCKNTPKNARVDGIGCAMDVDNDGVIDLYDKCLTIPGTHNGCPCTSSCTHL